MGDLERDSTLARQSEHAKGCTPEVDFRGLPKTWIEWREASASIGSQADPGAIQILPTAYQIVEKGDGRVKTENVLELWESMLRRKSTPRRKSLLDYFIRGVRRSRIEHPPGYGLLWFADFFYSRKSVEECLRPTIQDLQDEYAEALAAKRPHKARWVRIRGTWSFVCAAGMLTMASIGKQVVKIWKAVG
jgi:hypothetical protein